MYKILDALKFALELKKADRTRLAMIKSESNLKKFLTKHNIPETKETIKSFKCVIPALYKLQKFINEIDNEINISEVLIAPVLGTVLKRFRNVPNFSRVMKNFERAALYIKFTTTKAKVIAIRFNENWKAPKKDAKLIIKNNAILTTFNLFKNKFIEYQTNQIKGLLKIDDLNKVAEEQIRLAKLEIKYNEFPFAEYLTLEQAIEIFKLIYGFNPTRSNNNGLYVLILELKEKFFNAGTKPPVHEVNTVETKLAKAGILKTNTKPNLYLKFIKAEDSTFYFSLMNDNNKLNDFMLIIENDIIHFHSIENAIKIDQGDR